MPRHSETRHLPYSPEQLFDLVADVARYDEFLPWVVAVRVRSSSETETVADLVVGFNAFKERFTSRVTKQRPSHICVDYIEGPLKYLKNEWRFEAASHHYIDQRAIVDQVPESTLRRTHQDVAARFPVEWRALLGLAA